MLNFDGPKFTFVFDKIVNVYLRKAAQKALGKGSDQLVERIITEFSDTIAVNEEELRRETEKIDSNSGRYDIWRDPKKELE